ncbi:MAG TPA: hypothetical protein VHE35_17735 [Kofleriaceae bacterium]|nr:hypothetical protein [Kofleriaceae bacterium]
MRPPRVPRLVAIALPFVTVAALAGRADAQHATPLSPACGTELASLQTTLVATNSDDPPQAYLYHFQLFSDPALTILVTESPLTAQGAAGTTSWSVPATLVEDHRYYWRVRVKGATDFGPWSAACSFFTNTVNEAPGIPRIDSPAFGAQVNTFTPVLEVDNATDPDLDPLHYQFSLYSDPALSNQVTATPPAGVAEGANGTTSWQVPAAANLMEDHFYYWHVRACDPENLCGGDSATGQFFVTTTNAPPEAPPIVSPQNGSTVGTLRPDLVILNADDADFDPLVYDWDLATDLTFTTIIDGAANVPPQGAQSTALELSNDLLEDHRYCLRVRSDDGQAQSHYNVACFLVSEHDDAPSVPTLEEPSDGMGAASVHPVFSWAPSTDPEDEPITYDLEVKDDAGTLVGSVMGVSGTVTSISPALANRATYTWRARAVDRSGAASEFSPENTFTIDDPSDTGCCHTEGSCNAGDATDGRSLAPLGLGLAVLALRRRRARREPPSRRRS